MSANPASAETARIALRCLDLTRLDDHDTEADIDRLCARARGRFGDVAAVSVWPRFAAQARRQLPASIRVAAVANFPAGGGEAAAVLREVQAIAAAGAQEADVVLPWRALRAGDALHIEVTALELAKCERCWHYSDDVGANPEHPTLCKRCDSNLHGSGDTRTHA